MSAYRGCVSVVNARGDTRSMACNAPADACDAICTSGNYEETFSSLWGRYVQNINYLQWIIPLMYSCI